ncbi:MAG: hypothetical protein ACXWC6_09020 [Ramlibacter sp.]
MRYSRADYAKILAAQNELARAEDDYRRLRAAYVQIARDEPGHEVALAMVGADMDRAHVVLQSLIGLPPMPFAPDASKSGRQETERDHAEQEGA